MPRDALAPWIDLGMMKLSSIRNMVSKQQAEDEKKVTPPKTDGEQWLTNGVTNEQKTNVRSFR